MKNLRTEKRIANVGERILIVDVDSPFNTYRNGDILTVKELEEDFAYIRVLEHNTSIFHSEYEVIIENETEGGGIGMINEIEARFEEAVEQAREAIEELRLAAMAKGYEDARKDLTETKPKTLEVGDLVRALAKCVKENRDRIIKEANAYVPIVRQHQRDAIVEQAKKDVAELSTTWRPGCPSLNYSHSAFDPEGSKVNFSVNNAKRTVVCYITYYSPVFERARTSFRGIAKCTPTDCFNAHIGKAIALRRALGLEVPAEYLNAPQPTEVRVGDVVTKPYWDFNDPYKVSDVRSGNVYDFDGTYASLEEMVVIDDTREGVDGE